MRNNICEHGACPTFETAAPGAKKAKTLYKNRLKILLVEHFGQKFSDIVPKFVKNVKNLFVFRTSFSVLFLKPPHRYFHLFIYYIFTSRINYDTCFVSAC